MSYDLDLDYDDRPPVEGDDRDPRCPDDDELKNDQQHHDDERRVRADLIGRADAD